MPGARNGLSPGQERVNHESQSHGAEINGLLPVKARMRWQQRRQAEKSSAEEHATPGEMRGLRRRWPVHSGAVASAQHPTQRTAEGRREESRGLENEEREIGSRGVPVWRQSRTEPRSASLAVLPGSMQGPSA